MRYRSMRTLREDAIDALLNTAGSCGCGNREGGRCGEQRGGGVESRGGRGVKGGGI